MAKAGFLAKKSGFMMMETETASRESLDGGGLGLQPFSPATTTCASFRSPVGMAAAAACLRYPFTTAQWQELERQALIFKYMMASVPVPHHLLIPSTTNPLSLSHSALSRGWFVHGLDPEPGRCRRTDGKKWRCSRDVAAPEKKYCERHMHRSRQRSRKHVEVHTDNTISSSPSLAPPSHSGSATSTVSRQLGSSPRPYPSPDFKSLPVETLGSLSPYKDSRFMNWKHKDENSPMLSQDLQWLMQAKGDSERGASLYQDRNPNLFTDFAPPGFEGLGSRHQNEERCLYMKPESEPSEQRQMSRHFIDVGSNSRQNSPRGTSKSSANFNEKLSPFTLSLSMSSDNEVGEDMDQLQMGLGVIGSECDNAVGRKPQLLNWMSPVPWTGSSLGGPLGEVLQSSNSISQVESKHVNPRNVKKSSSSSGATNLMMDDWGGSRHTSPPRTAMSSPSGVLHRILTSPSDSSGGNSPTYKTAAMTEVVRQWMNQNK